MQISVKAFRSLLGVVALFFPYTAKAVEPASVIVIGPGPIDFSARLDTKSPVSFVIAEKGIRHSLEPNYVKGGIISVPILPPAPYEYTSVLETGPQGLTVSEAGVVEWIPSLDLVGNTEFFTVRFRVYENGAEIFTVAKTYGLRVFAKIPQMREPAPMVSHEQEPSGGWDSIVFKDEFVTDTDRKFFRWSLIGAPIGVTLDKSGGIHWPDDRGYAREEPYTFKVRIDYETPKGSVSDEVTYSRRVLPEPATTNESEPNAHYLRPHPFGRLGISTAGGDGWLVAGEPSSRYMNPGRVKLWKKTSDRDPRYFDFATLQPPYTTGGEAFGASVSLSIKTASHPTRLAVGAPEAERVLKSGTIQRDLGRVYIYACDAAGTWRREAKLNPPVPLMESLYFGGWVSILGDTLIASIEGEQSAGWKTGALAIYRHDGTAWSFSQLLHAPIPAGGELFSYPCDLSGDWIAAAANESDEKGYDTGAVHLYQKNGTRYIHRQQLHAPTPQENTFFGERLLIRGNWLFVSSFRENENRGAVHVFKLARGAWNFHQTIVSPFAGEGSAFGSSLSLSDNVIAISAPGYLMGDPSITGENYPWKGITQFRMEGDSWKWHRHLAESPSSEIRETWGYSLTQLDPNLTIASIPDMLVYDPYQQQTIPFAGRLFLHRWPEPLADPFAGVLAALPPVNGATATATGDANQNGVPNLIDWLMGQDPGNKPNYWDTQVPLGKVPFLKYDHETRKLRYMVPQLRSALRHIVNIEISHDLIEWRAVPKARWEAQEDVLIPTADGSKATSYFMPVLIPTYDLDPGRSIFVRMSAE